MVDNDLNTTSNQRSRSFILLPIDFSYSVLIYMTIMLPVVTLAVGCTV